MRWTLVVVGIALATSVSAESALEQLQNAPKPIFKEGHTLLPLSTWGPEFDFGIRKELCENWGYCLQFGRLRPQLVERLDDPESVESKVCALAKSDPAKYPLHVVTAPAFTIRSFIDELPEETWCHDAEDNLIDGKKVWSPEAPDRTFEMIAEREERMISKVLQRAPITILTNGGEYSVGVLGFEQKRWEQDPKVMAAKGDMDWFEYVSMRKAHHELIVSDRLRELVPGRRLYVYYFTDGCSHRGRYGSWWQWAWDYKWMRPVSDMPNSSVYWRHFNDGWVGGNDCLTQALNATAQHLAVGDRLSYNWMSPGWPGKGRPAPDTSDPEHYIGYMKCYYTAGMIGGVAGYFAYDSEDNWMWQLMCLGRVQALFSHLEDFVRNSDLLPGPDLHVWSKTLPACEFPTGSKEARVLARAHHDGNQWLVTAWAAAGDAREVEVEIPRLGKISVGARSAGSVYLVRKADGQVTKTLIDTNAALPTQNMAPVD